MRSIRGLRAARGMLCLAVLGADSRATTLCIDREGRPALETAFAGRCAGCDDGPLAPVGEPQTSGQQLRAAADCDGCLDLDVAGVEQGARRELELAGLAAPVLVPALQALPAPAPGLIHTPRALALDASPGALPRARILRC